MNKTTLIDRVDHLVLTCASVERTVEFYGRVLGMEALRPSVGPTALMFGRNKINLHQAGREFEPKALKPTVGAGDFCLIASVPLTEIIARLEREHVAIEVGPVKRLGAIGPMMSVYFRDPDSNLVEVASYD